MVCSYSDWSSSSSSISSRPINFLFELKVLLVSSSSSKVVEETITLVEESEPSLNFTTGWWWPLFDPPPKFSLDWRSAESLELLTTTEAGFGAATTTSAVNVGFVVVIVVSEDDSLLVYEPIRRLASSHRRFNALDCGESSYVCTELICSFFAVSSSFFIEYSIKSHSIYIRFICCCRHTALLIVFACFRILKQSPIAFMPSSWSSSRLMSPNISNRMRFSMNLFA